MQRWAGRVAVVTGASSPVGSAIAKELVHRGLKVVGLARRVENVESLATSLQSSPGKLYAVKADLTQLNEVTSVFRWIRNNLNGVDILVNNAGTTSPNTLINGPVEAWKKILELNVLALSVCTKEAIQSMRERGVEDGHIVHINSVAGYVMIPHYSPTYMYNASRNANASLTEGMRQELLRLKSKIRITSICPGMVRRETDPEMETDITDPYANQPQLEPQDVADAVLYVLGTPPHVQIEDLILRPAGEVSARTS